MEPDASSLTPIPEEWLVERDWYIVHHWKEQFCEISTEI